MIVEPIKLEGLEMKRTWRQLPINTSLDISTKTWKKEKAQFFLIAGNTSKWFKKIMVQLQQALNHVSLMETQPRIASCNTITLILTQHIGIPTRISWMHPTIPHTEPIQQEKGNQPLHSLS